LFEASKKTGRQRAEEKTNNKIMYYGYHFWGMHLIWWVIWILLLFWIFFTPYDIPGRRSKSSALDILQRRFASGEISKEDYEERKKVIESDLLKYSKSF
jgi:putative membrane protein